MFAAIRTVAPVVGRAKAANPVAVTHLMVVRMKSALASGKSTTKVPAGVRGKSTATPTTVEAAEATTRPSAYVDALLPRFLTTAEIAVSKIFPAGFGWQGASVLADNAGFAADSLGFYMFTGAGDFAGVFIGHTAYFGLKRALFDKSINMAAEAQTALLLASAAFGSGFVWQLALNGFQAAALPFATCALGTAAVCGATFFGGLRVSRAVYPKLGMKYIEAPTYRNLRDDAALSVAIGGATGMFVGTDVSMADNVFRGFVGIEDGFSTATGMAIAGKSTAVGFLGVQAAMNAFLPAGRNWLDQEHRA